MPSIAEEGTDLSERLIQPVARDAVSHSRRHTNRVEYSIFAPLMLLSTALVVWFAFQTVQLVRERGELATITGNQETSVAEAAKVRQALDALASSTKRLADEGNANAQLIVQELQKRGVTINVGK